MHPTAYPQYDKKTMARVVAKNMAASTKQCLEICAQLRNKQLQKAKSFLEQVLDFKQAVPFRRFTNGIGHKAGMAAGSYPQNAAKELLMMLNSVEANAQQKGLSATNLYIAHIVANRAPKAYHYGRRPGRRMKRTHIEIIVTEKSGQDVTQKKEKRQRTAKGKEQQGQKEPQQRQPSPGSHQKVQQ